MSEPSLVPDSYFKKDPPDPSAPCPFCASRCVDVEPIPQGYQVECHDCGAAGPKAATEFEAVRLWDTRK